MKKIYHKSHQKIFQRFNLFRLYLNLVWLILQIQFLSIILFVYIPPLSSPSFLPFSSSSTFPFSSPFFSPFFFRLGSIPIFFLRFYFSFFLLQTESLRSIFVWSIVFSIIFHVSSFVFFLLCWFLYSLRIVILVP